MDISATSIPDMVDGLIRSAIRMGVSDIHIDLDSSRIRIRFRRDGLLLIVKDWPRSIHSEFISRIKVLAGLRTDLHNSPQDGRFHYVDDVSSDVRVSTVPAHFGESAVLRILPSDRGDMSLTGLGFSVEQSALIDECILNTSGMILVTGPTGTGKTSTQYSILSRIDSVSRAIVTLEDPIEYTLPGVRQIPISSRFNLSFANGLRSVLRQDPDVIMVGEIRDRETAEISVHAALTGHLLISTLHTGSAIDTLPRLIDMGIDPYLISSTLSLVINQKLVRKICSQCLGGGCRECRQSGYSGRTVISEILQIDDRIRGYIMRRVSSEDIYKYARSVGFVPMEEDARRKVDLGITTREEVCRVLNMDIQIDL